MKINDRIMAISNKISGKTRFEARLTQDEKAFFERAAAIGGYRSLTEFVIRSAVKQAEEIIQTELPISLPPNAAGYRVRIFYPQ